MLWMLEACDSCLYLGVLLVIHLGIRDDLVVVVVVGLSVVGVEIIVVTHWIFLTVPIPLMAVLSLSGRLMTFVSCRSPISLSSWTVMAMSC